MDRVRGVDTDRVGDAMQIDAGIHGHAIAAGAAIFEAIDGRDGNAIGIEIAELPHLLISEAAAIPGGAERQAVAGGAPVGLSGGAPGMLLIVRAGEDPGAFLRGFTHFEPLRDASPKGKRLGGRVARERKATVAGGRQRGDVGGA